jgi:uncharacterized protein
MAMSIGWKETAVAFYSPAESPTLLAGSLMLPKTEQRAPGIVLCHPQPLIADMHDIVITANARELTRRGFATLRFNFRGVAPSEGEMTDGRLEPLDIAGAVTWLAARPETDGQMAIVGHGFGAAIALYYATIDARIKTVVAVSPPWFRLTAALAEGLRCPTLFITGEEDEVCPPFKLEPWMARIPGPKGLSVIAGGSHMLRWREEESALIAADYLERWAIASSV